KRQSMADETRAKLELQLRDIEQQKRVKIQEGVAEGQRVAAEIQDVAHALAATRIQAGEDEVARELERAKEMLKEQMIRISLRGAEKILREKLDDAHQRKLMGEFIDEVGAAR